MSNQAVAAGLLNRYQIGWLAPKFELNPARLAGAILLVCKTSGDAAVEDICEESAEMPDSMHAGGSYAKLADTQQAARQLPAGSSLDDGAGDHDMGPDDALHAEVVEVTRAD